ncbi:hypothetical protein TNCV_299411 [Trichonephila clavipes]|nr:hypothetical protein TNCV_299411 [Trichonephila clavipes]
MHDPEALRMHPPRRFVSSSPDDTKDPPCKGADTYVSFKVLQVWTFGEWGGNPGIILVFRKCISISRSIATNPNVASKKKLIRLSASSFERLANQRLRLGHYTAALQWHQDLSSRPAGHEFVTMPTKQMWLSP